MDIFASLIENKSSFPKTLKVRKVYINEDPKLEKCETCPKCWAQNRQSSVRYMFINMQEAIFKCEAAGCMYPFRDYKYKNYIEQTVYHYRAVDEELLSLSDFGPLLTNMASTHKDIDKATSSPSEHFNIDFESPGASTSANTPGQSEVNIFDSPSLSYKNLAEGFDTGFIDDILSELGEPSPEKKAVDLLPVQPVAQLGITKSKRQLKRCLQMFQADNVSIVKPDNELFKVPPPPRLETSNPYKPKFKKVSPPKKHKSNQRRTNDSNFSERLLKKTRIKPLQFLETLNSIRTNPEDGQRKDIHPSANKKMVNNQKVARMLDFIERSMKNRAPVVEPAFNRTDPALKRVIRKTSKRKEMKKRSLSETVLHDSQFEYSSSEEEPGLSSSSVGSDNDSTPCSDDETFLPCFQELIDSIHPCQFSEVKKLEQPATATIGGGTTGFRSAGCSPTRIEPWETIVPRRIQSMESLSSLLE